MAKLIVTVHVVGTFPRNVRGGEVGTAPRAVRDLDAADCGRVVDASLPDAVATGLCARERRPWAENGHGIYSEAYTEGADPFGREKLTFDLWRFKREGYVIAEMEFESPLKGWVE